MKTFSENEIQEKFAKLSRPLMEAVYSPENAEAIVKASTTYGIKGKAISNVAGEVGYLILGLTRPDELSSRIGERVGLDQSKALALSKDLYQSVLRPIAPEIKRVNGFDITENSFASATTATPKTESAPIILERKLPTPPPAVSQAPRPAPAPTPAPTQKEERPILPQEKKPEPPRPPQPPFALSEKKIVPPEPIVLTPKPPQHTSPTSAPLPPPPRTPIPSPQKTPESPFLKETPRPTPPPRPEPAHEAPRPPQAPPPPPTQTPKNVIMPPTREPLPPQTPPPPVIRSSELPKTPAPSSQPPRVFIPTMPVPPRKEGDPYREHVRPEEQELPQKKDAVHDPRASEPPREVRKGEPPYVNPKIPPIDLRTGGEATGPKGEKTDPYRESTTDK